MSEMQRARERVQQLGARTASAGPGLACWEVEDK